MKREILRADVWDVVLDPIDATVDGTSGQALCEQIRTVSKKRLKSKKSKLLIMEMIQIKLVMKQMLFD